ncbi:MAG TPA: ABC transporter permease, partial [Gemmatimonadaceae bacterium]|nr:ABC transporter permease [Gemmatimonadaceae bacterium]
MLRRVFRLRFAKRHLESEIAEELEFHLAMRERSLVEQGMSPVEARATALRQFGDVGAVRDDCVSLDQQRDRAMNRASAFTDLTQDFVYAVRTLRRNFGFTAIAVATLALGIGANTAIFGLIDAVLLRKLPVPAADRLVSIGDATRVGGMSNGSPRPDLMPYRIYTELRQRSRAFSGVMASGRAPRLSMTVGAASGEPDHPRGRLVSGNYFHVLRVPAFIGRTFGTEEDGNPGASPVAVISHDYWQRRFDADPGIIGKTVTINGAGVTIVGVTPPWFTGEIVGARPEMWLPITLQPMIVPNQDWLSDPHFAFLLLLGRLNDGTTIAQARSEVQTQVPRLLRELAPDAEFAKDVDRFAPSEIQVEDGSKGFSRVRSTFFVPLMTLMAGVALLLLIVCANVA